MVNLKVVQKLHVLEGRGFVHVSFVALQTGVKVYICDYLLCFNLAYVEKVNDVIIVFSFYDFILF